MHRDNPETVQPLEEEPRERPSKDEAAGPPRLDQIREALIRLQSVADVGQLLIERDPSPACYAEVLQQACVRIRATIALFFLCDAARDQLELAASLGLEALPGGPPPRVALGCGLSGWVAQTRTPYLCNDLHEDGHFDSTSFLHYERLSAVSVPICHRERLLGVLTFANEARGAFSQADLLTAEAMAASLALGLRSHELRAEARNSDLASIQGLINALEAKDPDTQGHSLRIAHFCRELGRSFGFSADRQERLVVAARLHDIGKIGIPEPVLHKPAALTDPEWEMVRRHPEIGAEILRGIPALAEVSRIVAAHHERMDGSGYPAGLCGVAIPLESRIIAVADAFDAMVTARPYRSPHATDAALAELEACANKQFDGEVVRRFCALVRRKSPAHFYGGWGILS